MPVNVDRITSVRTALNGRLYAKMENGEEILITRRYAVIGSLFARNNSISFVYFFLPFGLALICMIPCIPIYLKEDMTISQIMWQRGIELVVLEIAMCAVIYLIMGDSVSTIVYVAILISTAVCDVLSYLVKWYPEKERQIR